MFNKILWFSDSPSLRCELWKNWKATNCGGFLRKFTSKAGKNYFFKVWAPMSSVKCHTPLDVKLHWAQCIKSNYNRMESFPISEIKNTQIVSNLQVWATIIGSHLTRKPTASSALTKWWNLELTLATNFGSHTQMVTKIGGQILATKFGFVPECWALSVCVFQLSITNLGATALQV